MDLELSISNRQIKDGVVKVFQHETGTTTLRFILDGYKYDEVDLRNYKPYAVTSINGDIDLIELKSTFDGTNLIVEWTLGDYTTRHIGALQYQIAFKESRSIPAVFYTYKAIIVVRETIDADSHITANYPTLLQQWIERINELAGSYDSAIFYMQPNNPLDIGERLAGRLYYQIENTTTGEGHFEDHTGKRIGEFNAKYVTNADLNTMLEHGEYICGGTISNAPIGTTYCIVRVTDTANTNQIIQEVFVPVNANLIRSFTRVVVGSNTFGEWQELSSVGYVDAMVRDKDFEIKSLIAMHNNELTDLYIETFIGISALSMVPSGYNSRLHNFKITETGDMIFTVKTASAARTKFWISVDYDDISSGSVIPQVSIDNGSSWITLTNSAVNELSSFTKFIVKLKLSGSLTLNNVAFGLK